MAFTQLTSVTLSRSNGTSHGPEKNSETSDKAQLRRGGGVLLFDDKK